MGVPGVAVHHADALQRDGQRHALQLPVQLLSLQPDQHGSVAHRAVKEDSRKEVMYFFYVLIYLKLTPLKT